MSIPIPESHRDLITEKVTFANLATLMKDGSPQVTPVWFSWDGTHILVNTAKGRVKDKNLAARPMVAISIQDPANPYRSLGLRGKVVASDESPAADAHIDALAKKYLNADTYPYRAPGEKRVIYKIEPLSFFSWG